MAEVAIQVQRPVYQDTAVPSLTNGIPSVFRVVVEETVVVGRRQLVLRPLLAQLQPRLQPQTRLRRHSAANTIPSLRPMATESITTSGAKMLLLVDRNAHGSSASFNSLFISCNSTFY